MSDLLNTMAVASIFHSRQAIEAELRNRVSCGDRTPMIFRYHVHVNRPFNSSLAESHIIAFAVAIIWPVETDIQTRFYRGVLHLMRNVNLRADGADFDAMLYNLFAQFHGGRFQPFPTVLATRAE